MLYDALPLCVCRHLLRRLILGTTFMACCRRYDLRVMAMMVGAVMAMTMVVVMMVMVVVIMVMLAVLIADLFAKVLQFSVDQICLRRHAQS